MNSLSRITARYTPVTFNTSYRAFIRHFRFCTRTRDGLQFPSAENDICVWREIRRIIPWFKRDWKETFVARNNNIATLSRVRYSISDGEYEIARRITERVHVRSANFPRDRAETASLGEFIRGKWPEAAARDSEYIHVFPSNRYYSRNRSHNFLGEFCGPWEIRQLRDPVSQQSLTTRRRVGGSSKWNT